MEYKIVERKSLRTQTLLLLKTDGGWSLFFFSFTPFLLLSCFGSCKKQEEKLDPVLYGAL
jgi:hypothetical protein